jgi:hypothetical protein
MTPRRDTWVGLLLSGTLLLQPLSAAAQQSTPTLAKKHGRDATAPAKTQANGGGMAETLKVSGAWTITVRNADGTVAARHKFNNALVSRGSADIIRMLTIRTPEHYIKYWYVVLGPFSHAHTPGAPCLDSFDNSSKPCVVATGGSVGLPIQSFNLVASAPTSGPDAGRMVLAGSVRTDQAGQISEVSSHATFTAFETMVTHHTLSTPIAVQAKQTIDLTIVLGFS